jgi:hypothetical protein
VRAIGSPKTVAASGKAMPCLARLAAAFSGSPLELHGISLNVLDPPGKGRSRAGIASVSLASRFDARPEPYHSVGLVGSITGFGAGRPGSMAGLVDLIPPFPC